MQMDVSTTEVELDTTDYADAGMKGQVLILQNLGPDDLYLDFLTGVDADTGVKISSGGGYEVTGWSPSMSIFVISDGTSDLRYAVAG